MYTKIWMALHKKCIDVQNYPKCTSFWNGQLYFQNVYDLFVTIQISLWTKYFLQYIFLSHLTKGYVSSSHDLVSVVCRLLTLHILIFCLKLLNQIEPNLVLGKRRFRLEQMKFIFLGEGLLRAPKSSGAAPIEMV